MKLTKRCRLGDLKFRLRFGPEPQASALLSCDFLRIKQIFYSAPAARRLRRVHRVAKKLFPPTAWARLRSSYKPPGSSASGRTGRRRPARPRRSARGRNENTGVRGGDRRTASGGMRCKVRELPPPTDRGHPHLRRPKVRSR